MSPEERLDRLDIYHGNLKEKLAEIIREAERDAWNAAVDECALKVGVSDYTMAAVLRALKRHDVNP